MIINIKYADDTLELAENLCDLQQVMVNIVNHFERYVLNMNVTNPHNRDHIYIGTKSWPGVDICIFGQ